MKKIKNKINKDMMIGEIVELYPDLATVMAEEYGFHCVGCFASGMETLEQGAMGHGMTEEEIAVMVESLNELVN